MEKAEKLYNCLFRLSFWGAAGWLDYAWVVLYGYQSKTYPSYSDDLILTSTVTWLVLGVLYHLLIGRTLDRIIIGTNPKRRINITTSVDLPLILFLVVGFRVNDIFLPSIKDPLSIAVNIAMFIVAALLVTGAVILEKKGKEWVVGIPSGLFGLAFVALGLYGMSVADPQVILFSNKPDIILVTLDTVRADHLGCYGYDRDTSPNLDEFGAHYQIFTNCRTPMPLTGPSHASLFSGEMPQVHNVLSNISAYPDSPDIPSIAEELSKAGYITAGFPAAVHLGKKFNFDRGFWTYNQSTVVTGPPFLQGCYQLTPYAILSRLGIIKETFLVRNSREVNKAFKYWYDNSDLYPSVPKFVWIHYFDAHSPYQPPDSYWQKFDPDYSGFADGSQEQCESINAQIESTNMGETLPDGWSQDDIDNMVARYDGDINFVDESVGELFNYLLEKGTYNDTIIIIVSDHGEGLYDDGYFGHNYTLKDYETRLVCMIKGPLILDDPDPMLSITDITDYIENVSGISNKPCRLMGGTIENDDPYASMVFLKSHAWIDWPYKLIRTQGEEGRGIFYDLYNLENDPSERTNLFVPGDEVSVRLTDEMDSWIETNHADFRTMLKNENVLEGIDPSTLDMLRSLGYIY